MTTNSKRKALSKSTEKSLLMRMRKSPAAQKSTILADYKNYEDGIDKAAKCRLVDFYTGTGLASAEHLKVERYRYVVIPLGPILYSIKDLNATSITLRLVADTFSNSIDAIVKEKRPDTSILSRAIGIEGESMQLNTSPKLTSRNKESSEWDSENGPIYYNVEANGYYWLCCYCQKTWNSFSEDTHCAYCNHGRCEGCVVQPFGR